MTIYEQVLIAPYTTFKIGGKARYFCTVTSIDELIQAGIFAQQKSLPLCVLGGGSNVLVSDLGFDGLLIRMVLTDSYYKEGSESEVLVTAGAGVVFDDLVLESVEKGLWGLENLSHIPGSVGATPIQNVGAYGVEVSELISEVCTYNFETQSEKVFTHAECKFGYRDSFFKTTEGKKYVVTHVTFRLQKNSGAKIQYADLVNYFSKGEEKEVSVAAVREAIIAIRAEKFPDWNVVGTAGSFFKNPIISRADALLLRHRYPELPLYELDSTSFKCSLGYILDKVCGLKGFRLGNVRLYEKQALVVVSDKGATADEVRAFAQIVSKKVFEHTGIRIESEVNFLFS